MILRNLPNLTCNFPLPELTISPSLASFVSLLHPLVSLLLVFPTPTLPLAPFHLPTDSPRSPQAKTQLSLAPLLWGTSPISFYFHQSFWRTGLHPLPHCMSRCQIADPTLHALAPWSLSPAPTSLLKWSLITKSDGSSSTLLLPLFCSSWYFYHPETLSSALQSP